VTHASQHRTGVVMCLIAALSLLSACASADSPATATTGSTSVRTPAPRATPGKPTPVPTSSTAFPVERAHPDPNYDTGFWIQITSTGFHPAWLVAPCCEAITWKNLTGTPVVVVFDHVLGGSVRAIAPGGTYIFVPLNVESITYHSGTNPSMKGRIQVNQLPE
jgi:hypothetical protein